MTKPEIYTDQTGREVRIPAPPRRIVSLVPSQTELLYDLGLSDEVVGITTFCIHPAHWRQEKTRIGGTKRLHMDTIRSLAPDLIIANKEENEKDQVEALMQEFPVWVSDVHDLDSALTMIREVGKITGKQEMGNGIIKMIHENFDALRKDIAHLPLRRVAYFIWRDPWMTAGGDTFIDAMLRECRLENVFAGQNRYPSIALNDLHTTDCQLVLLSSEPFPFSSKHISEIPDFPVKLVDGEMFSWYGSRLLKAPEYFRRLLNTLIVQ